MRTRLAKWKKDNKIEETATAQQALEKLISDYEINTELYDEAAVRKIAGVRYDMVQKLFNSRNSFTMMKNVNMEIISMIKENNKQFENVVIVSEPVRSYPNGTLGAHLLGNVGSIYKEEYEMLKDQGYSMNDLIGKDGIEKYLETYLRGEDGRDSIQYNTTDDGVVVAGSVAAVPGDKANFNVRCTCTGDSGTIAATARLKTCVRQVRMTPTAALSWQLKSTAAKFWQWQVTRLLIRQRFRRTTAGFRQIRQNRFGTGQSAVLMNRAPHSNPSQQLRPSQKG